MAVYAAHLLELLPSTCETLHLSDHVRGPCVRVSQQHGTELLLAQVPLASPAAPHSGTHFDGHSLALLPPPAHSGVHPLSSCGNAPVIPIISRNVDGPESGFSIPCIDAES